MAPQGILVLAWPLFMLQLLQGTGVIVFFEITDYPMSRDAINELQSLASAQGGVCNDMQMVRHNHVCIYCEVAGSASFVKCFASYYFDFVRLENGQAIFGY